MIVHPHIATQLWNNYLIAMLSFNIYYQHYRVEWTVENWDFYVHMSESL